MMWTNDLPLHVKEQIFSNLSQWDRFNVRLVCKDWYDSTWSYKLCSNECITIRGMEREPSAAVEAAALDTFIIGSESKKLYNVRFIECSLTLSDSERTFWSRFGSSIRHLILDDCNVNLASIHFILETCSHLETVLLSSSSIASVFPTELIKTNLSSLKNLQFSPGPDPETQLGLESFGKCLATLDELTYQILIRPQSQTPESSEVDGSMVTDFKTFLNNVHVKSVDLHLEILCYSNPVNCGEIEEILSVENLTLKELTISHNQNSFKIDMCQAFQSVTRHRNTLTSLSLHLHSFASRENDSSQQFGDFLQCIASLSNLDSFRLTCFWWLHPDDAGRFATIVWVALESLAALRRLWIQAPNYDGRNCDNARWDCVAKSFPVAFGCNLKEFDICCSYLGSCLLRPESTLNFKTLTSLTLDSCRRVSNQTLQRVCKECISLTNLTVHELYEKEDESTGDEMIYSWVTDSAWTGQTNLLPWISVTASEEGAVDISNLNNLEQLSLWGVFGDPTVLRIRFSKLLSLELLIADINDASLLSIANNNPNLESVKIGSVAHYGHYGTGICGSHTPPPTAHPYFPQLTWHGIQQFLEAATKLEQFSVKPQCVEFDADRIQQMMRARPSLQKINGRSTWKPFIASHAATKIDIATNSAEPWSKETVMTKCSEIKQVIT